MKLLRSLLLALVFVSGFAMALYALSYLSLNPDWGFLESKSPSVKSGVVWQFCFYGHLLAGIVAIVLGPFQFIQRLRKRYPKAHRLAGVVYVGAIVVGGLLALYSAAYADGGPIGKSGFMGLALAWLITTVIAFAKIRQGKVNQHEQWMIRSYAVTWAAVSFRILIGVGIAAGLTFDISYRLTAWFCWLVNLGVAEFIIYKLMQARGQKKPAYQETITQ